MLSHSHGGMEGHAACQRTPASCTLLLKDHCSSPQHGFRHPKLCQSKFRLQIFPTQIRQFKPKLVAIKDSSKVAELKELIKDVAQQPEILVGHIATHNACTLSCLSILTCV